MELTFNFAVIALLIIIILLITANLKNEYYVDPFTNHAYTLDEIYEHLCFVDDALMRHNIKHWIMFGTLLGAVRDGDIISHDFNIGANIKDVNKIMAVNSEINQYGYKFKLPIDTVGYNYINDNDTKVIWRVSIKIEYNNITMGNIYLFDKFDDGIMRRFDKKSGTYITPNISFPSWFVDNLTTVIIRDRLFASPIYPQILLEQWYGKTWQTQIKSKAQSGGDVDSDYYGISKHISMKNLIDFVAGHGGISLKSNLDKQVKYYYPFEQKEWIVNNDY